MTTRRSIPDRRGRDINDSRLVSVVMIFLNEADHLQEAIESVVAQTYEDWELLLVDDGSTDGSENTAREYARRYPGRVRYIEHEGHQNLGMSASRNRAIAESSGEYVAFLDGDDVWLPEKLREQVALMEMHTDAGMLYGNTLYWYSWRGLADGGREDFIPPLGVASGFLIKPPALVPRFVSGTIAVPCMCSVMVRRSALQGAQVFEPSFRGMYEDQVFYSKICLEQPTLISDRCWDKYRQRDTSATGIARRNKTEMASRARFLDWLEDYANARQVGDAALLHALRREKWRLKHPRLATLIRRSERALRRITRHLPGRDPL